MLPIAQGRIPQFRVSFLQAAVSACLARLSKHEWKNRRDMKAIPRRPAAVLGNETAMIADMADANDDSWSDQASEGLPADANLEFGRCCVGEGSRYL